MPSFLDPNSHSIRGVTAAKPERSNKEEVHVSVHVPISALPGAPPNSLLQYIVPQPLLTKFIANQTKLVVARMPQQDQSLLPWTGK